MPPKSRHSDAGIFIDCGANVGKVLAEVFQEHPGWGFHAFEPNPECLPALHKLAIPNLTIHKEAVWVENGTQTLHLPRQILSATLMESKRNLPIAGTLEVPTLDLAAWLLSLPPDPVTLKMDIEGAEYRVLPHLLDKGALEQVVELHVEFHYDRMTDVTKGEHDTLIRKLNTFFGADPRRVGKGFYAKIIWNKTGNGTTEG